MTISMPVYASVPLRAAAGGSWCIPAQATWNLPPTFTWAIGELGEENGLHTVCFCWLFGELGESQNAHKTRLRN